MSTELATAYISLVPSFKGGQAAILKELGPAEVAASKSGASAGKGFVSSMKGKLGLAGGIGAGIGILKLGSDFASAYKTIRVGTGATGKSLKGLEGDMKAVLAQRPDNMRDVATAITGVAQATGITGKPLQELTKTYLRLSSLTGTDLASNLKATRPLFTSFGVAAEGQTSRLDLLYRASRQSGVSVADLASAMTSAGPAARSLGLNFDKTAALVSTFTKAGLGASASAAALTKFVSGAGARQTAAAKQVTAAQTQLAAAEDAVNRSRKPSAAQLIKVRDATQKLAVTQDALRRAQSPLPKQFASTLDAIKKAPSTLDAAAIASQAFGARSGPKLAEMLRSGKVSYEALLKSISGGKDTIAKSASDTQTMSGKLKILKNSFLVAIEPLASGAFDKGTKLLTTWGPKITRLVQAGAHMPGWVKGTATALVGLAVGAKVLGKVYGAANRVATSVKAMGSAARNGIRFFTKAGEDGYSKVDKLRLGLMRAKEAGSKLWSGMKSGASTLAGYAKQAASTALAIGKTVAAWVAEKVALVASKVATLAQAAAEKVVTAAQWLLNTALDANPITLIVIGIAALIAGFVLAYKKIGWFRAFVDATFRMFKSVIGSVVGFVKHHWQLLLAILTGPIGLAVLVITKNWDKIKTGFRIVRDFIGTAVTKIVGFVTGLPGRIARTIAHLWDGLKSGITTAKNWIRDRVTDVINLLLKLPGRISKATRGMWDGIKNAFKSALNWLIKKWNSLKFKMPSINTHIPGVGKIGGWSVGVPQIPLFHQGGVVPGRTGEEVPILAMAGERVLTARQDAALRLMMSSLGTRPRAATAAGDGRGAHWHFHGPDTGAVMRQLEVREMQQASRVAVS